MRILSPRVLLLAVVLAAGPAVADERCKVTTRAQAQAALAAIDGSVTLARFCLACGDREPVALQVASRVLVPTGRPGVVLEGRRFSADEVRHARSDGDGPLARYVRLLDASPEGRDFMLGTLQEMLDEKPAELHINGVAVDLASLYVPDDGGRWRNVGRQVGCGAAAPLLAWSGGRGAAE